MDCFRATGRSIDDDLQRILKKIWSIEFTKPGEKTTPNNWHKAQAYLRHYEDLLQDHSLIDGDNLHVSHLADRDDEVANLVELVKARSSNSADEIKQAIRDSRSPVLQRVTDESVAQAMAFVVRLWLFVATEFSGAHLAGLQDPPNQNPVAFHTVVSSSIIARHSRGLDELSDDFSAKSLIRKGAFEFEMTSDLNKHLTFDPNNRWCIRVFDCAQALEQLRLSVHK
jgi:hypothetical protein